MSVFEGGDRAVYVSQCIIRTCPRGIPKIRVVFLYECDGRPLDREGEKICAYVTSILLAQETHVRFVQLTDNVLLFVLVCRLPLVVKWQSIDGYQAGEKITKDISLQNGSEYSTFQGNPKVMLEKLEVLTRALTL